MSKSDERTQQLKAESPAFRPSGGPHTPVSSSGSSGSATDSAGSGYNSNNNSAPSPRNGSPSWSPKARFNPKSRFNPARSFNITEKRGGGNGSGSGPGGAGPSGPAGPGGAGQHTGAGGASGLFARPGSAETSEGKKFNPTSVFSPKRPASSAAPSGPAAGASPIAPNQSLVAPTGPAGVPTGPAAATASSSGVPESGVFSDLTPKFSPMLQEYNQLYHAPLHPLQYHLYAPTPFRVRPALEAHQRTVQDLFISNELREELQRRNDATLQVLATSTLPEFVHVYHSLMPLDTKIASKDRFGHPVWRYKAVSNTDGRTYCLFRVEDFELPREQALMAINKWMRLSSSSVVGVVEAFTTVAFGDHSLVIVYEYFPLAETLGEYYSAPLPEGLLWGLVAQIATGLHSIHRQNLAAGVLDSRSILVTQKNRLRVGSCGAHDVLECDTLPDLAERQRADWRDLAKVVLELAGAPAGASLDAEGRQKVLAKYSPAMLAFVNLLIDHVADESDTNVNENGERDTLEARAMRMLAPHLLRVLDTAMATADEMESTLAQELENARLVRLLCKLEFVIGWGEHSKDPAWAPTGAQYPLKLFMDYVFHQVTEQERPALDLAHALSALNKLDAGIDENILLVSHDETTRLVMSFKELRQMFDLAFRAMRKEPGPTATATASAGAGSSTA